VLCQLLDGFIQQLFKTTDPPSVQAPFMTLLRPEHLIVPGLSFWALVAWSSCTKLFGPIIADQAHLVSTLGGQVDDLVVAAQDRMSLAMAIGDERVRVCEQAPPDLFNLIWESSLRKRDGHLRIAEQIVTNSGLLELISQLRKAPRLVFIGLVNKLFYMKWLTETFRHLVNGRSEDMDCDFIETLAIQRSEIPTFSFEDAGDAAVGFKQDEVCELLHIPPFPEDFQSTDGLDFADRFMLHIECSAADPHVKTEAGTARTLFNQFAGIVRAKEKNLLEIAAQIKENLSRLAHQKCTREMEYFSARYRELRHGTLTRALFEPDFSTERPEIAEIGRIAARFDAYPLVAQRVVRSEDVVRVAQKMAENKVRYMNLEQFRDIIEMSSEIDTDARLGFELCARLACCIACFDTRSLLTLLVDNTDDRDQVMELLDNIVFEPDEIG
jgi:hypothetical protein